MVLSPIVDILNNKDILQEVDKAVAAMSKEASSESTSFNNEINIDYNQTEVLKENYIKNIQMDIKSRIEKKGYIYEKAEVSVNANYQIQSVSIKIKDNLSKGEKLMEINVISSIISEISNEYKLDEKNIKITKVGGEING